MDHSHILDVDQPISARTHLKNEIKDRLGDHPAINLPIREVMADPTIFTNVRDITLYEYLVWEYLVWECSDKDACENIDYWEYFNHHHGKLFPIYRDILLEKQQLAELEEDIEALQNCKRA